MDFAQFGTTELQKEIIKYWDANGQNTSLTVRAFPDSDERYIRRVLKKAKDAAAEQGYAPEFGMNNPLPGSFKAKKITTEYDGDGVVKRQWVSGAPKREMAPETIETFIKGLTEELPVYRPIAKPEKVAKDLLNCYVISDYHLGMLADAEKGGDDWNMEIAEKTLIEWFAQAIELAPDAEEGLFAQLGDFLHFDSFLPVTPSHHHILDASCLWHQLVESAARIVRQVCDMLLAKHERVRCIIATGNHDISSSTWLRTLLAHVYDNEPRFEIDMNPDVYYAYEFGKNSLFFHHGHKKKMAGISDVFVRKFRDMYGRTEFAYAHMGHLHHDKVLESNLMVLTQHRTLAAADAYATEGGWLSGRSADVVTYHRDYGKVCSNTISSAMVANSLDLR